jgi:hypothetical protein
MDFVGLGEEERGKNARREKRIMRTREPRERREDEEENGRRSGSKRSREVSLFVASSHSDAPHSFQIEICFRNPKL